MATHDFSISSKELTMIRQHNARNSTQAADVSGLRAMLRMRRKRMIGSSLPLQDLVCVDSEVQEPAVCELKDYLALRSAAILRTASGVPLPKVDTFCADFFSLAIRMIAGGGVGDESIDDLIQLAECLVRSKSTFITVAKNLLPSSHIGELFSFTDNYPENYFTIHFEDAVLGAVSVFLGAMEDPVAVEGEDYE